MSEPNHSDLQNIDRDSDSDRSPAVIGMSVAALSGGIIGLLVRGEFLSIAAVSLVGFACAYAGWWAKSIR